MRTPLLLMALVATAYAFAQEPAPANADLQRCLLRTTSETWTLLKLTPDQLQRMKFIQEACAEECKAAGAPGNQNPISHTDGSTVLGELRSVLTTVQYNAWMAGCKEVPSK
ncbi:MAG: hypothetical protein IPH05_03045 [Flavobacteriales bacterium]|jgi:hypothetical protein|nr:hypothetical protein [Flavobacteriales bacterium]MBK6549907.1 hypothetical protein [Flavobacteriales bacterium]MBK6881927.1 hypothetical protein [Flavobacteriales bacterium]MBK7102418.1 hypothetical protein [Flavobacteriales bacterium]MBK7113158.1 hypothetical protein [Flavobacteriales bacterium]